MWHVHCNARSTVPCSNTWVAHAGLDVEFSKMWIDFKFWNMPLLEYVCKINWYVFTQRCSAESFFICAKLRFFFRSRICATTRCTKGNPRGPLNLNNFPAIWEPPSTIVWAADLFPLNPTLWYVFSFVPVSPKKASRSAATLGGVNFSENHCCVV